MGYTKVASLFSERVAVLGMTDSSEYIQIKFYWFQMVFPVSLITSAESPLFKRELFRLCISKVCGLCLVLGVKCERDTE